jgi:predicted amino acid racemase
MRASPRLEISLEKIYRNSRILSRRLAERGIAITGVTKAALGSPTIARTMLRAGIRSLGDSRLENIERLRSSGIKSKLVLLRSPMLSQVDRVVEHTDVSCNSEVEVLRALSITAERTGRRHGVILMAELGDLREGIMPADMLPTIRKVLNLKGVCVLGIGTNLACLSGVVPDSENMGRLTSLVAEAEARFGLSLEMISGGNSASLEWATSGADVGRVNNLRLGEAILLGVDPLNRRPIAGLHTDAFKLIAEIIESKVKPTMPWGQFAQNGIGEFPSKVDRGLIPQSILALGHQDTEPGGLTPPEGISVLGSSGDHMMIESFLPIGSEVAFTPNYSALLKAMTSPFIQQRYTDSKYAITSLA